MPNEDVEYHKKKAKIFSFPFFFSIAFLVIFSFRHSKVVQLLNMPVLRFLSNYLSYYAINILLLYILTFIYWFFVGIVIEMIFIKKRHKIIFTIVLLLILLNTIINLPLGKPTERARILSCKSNLRQISLVLQQYACDYHGYFPDKNGAEGLELLRKNGYLADYKVYTCPSSSFIPGQGNEQLKEENISYCYKGGTKYSENNITPILWDKFENHKNVMEDYDIVSLIECYGNVVLANGKIINYETRDWEKFFDDNNVSGGK
ncbi:MAG: hypothetical protein A2017_05075 [Lentisphaerae bacterium GWF2_44_16]|nr:MAG: hypothetical protein A2017_05075 [Lentisphaerae bacterium GWF2_44_16]